MNVKPTLFILLFFVGLSSLSVFQAQQNEALALEVSDKLNHKLFDELLSTYVSAHGNVNYKGFQKEEQKLDQYLKTLSNANPYASNWTENDKLAFWINAYNAFTIKTILDNYPVESIKDIRRPWHQKFFKIAGEEMDLNHIEHEILRKMNEPRIHFAIVCASFSCPQLKNEAYKAEKIDAQLDYQARLFINDSQRNQIKKDELKLSKIFDWFTKDFTTNGNLIDFINRYSKIKVNADASISWLDYNWSLND